MRYQYGEMISHLNQAATRYITLQTSYPFKQYYIRSPQIINKYVYWLLPGQKILVFYLDTWQSVLWTSAGFYFESLF
jgi:hypothetical protein